MLSMPIPCTLRFLVGNKLRRAADIDVYAANALSRKNIEKLEELDRVLAIEPTISN